MLTGLALTCDTKNTEKDSFYVDNGATNHVTNRRDIFQIFETFGEPHKVMTANGDIIEAIGKGSIQLEADINGHKELLVLTNVWYVPSIERNLFSVLAAQDTLKNSIFQSTAQTCKMKNDGKVILVGNRDKYGGLYKLNVKVLMPKLRHKSEVHACLKDFLAEAKTSGHIVQELLSDNGGKFDNEQVRNTLRQYGVKQRFTMLYTPEQNGSCERENRTIVEMTRALMHAHDKIPEGLWAEIAKASVYILNRTGPTPIEGRSPHELWCNRKPRINHLKVIGCDCYVHVPKQRKTSKIASKAEKGILIGFI